MEDARGARENTEVNVFCIYTEQGRARRRSMPGDGEREREREEERIVSVLFAENHLLAERIVIALNNGHR